MALDKTPMDETLIRYGVFIAEVMHAKMIEFVHVVNEEDHEEELLKELKGKAREEETFKKEVLKKAGNYREGDTIEMMAHVVKGSPFHELLAFAKGNDIDLVIVGKKEEQHGSGILAHRFSAKSPCSVLFVPPKPEFRMDAILLPTDFSEYSSMAFKQCRFFREKYDEIQLLAAHIYRVPLGYYTTGKSYEEFAEIMRNNSEQEFNRFVEKYKLQSLDLEPVFALSEENNPGQLINDIAIRDGADLIIIGARGHSRVSSLVLGSTAEKLARSTKKIPVLILKEKGETLKLLDILMNI